jgi:hypothetical protein
MRGARLIASALLGVLALAWPAVAQTGRVSAGNSTSTPLTNDATYTGTWEDATQAAVVVVTIKSDQASATSGVKVQFSSDCSNLDYVSTASFTDTTNGQTVAVATASKCVRVVYVNGATPQATFRLQTIFRDAGFGGTSTSSTNWGPGDAGTLRTAPAVPTVLLNGNKVVTTAGTRVTLAASTTIRAVTIKALSTNTGIIYIGDTSAAAANGFQLRAGESVSLSLTNLSTINLDASVSGEGVTYAAVQ